MLRLNEVFDSISGEVGHIPQGAMTYFIRFQGCSRHCPWCDTKHALSSEGGKITPWRNISDSIPSEANVILTGGEPLEQPAKPLGKLINELLSRNCTVQMETNGCQRNPFPGVHTVYDYKPPSSNHVQDMMSMHEFFTPGMMPKQWVKFVVTNTTDANFVLALLNKIPSQAIVDRKVIPVISVPGSEAVNYMASNIKTFAAWIEPYLVFNFQLHKLFGMQ